MFQPIFTTEFLEKELGRQVASFRVAPGANPGDNFIGAIYALEVVLKPTEEYSTLFSNSDENNETVYLVGKFFPSNDLHTWLTNSNIFHKELLTYTSLLEELKLFVQTKVKKLNESKWPFAPIVGGKSIDFSKCGGIPVPSMHQPLITESLEDKTAFYYGPMDNFLLLTDVRKTYGFKMASLQSGLNWDHCSLIVEALAGIHAISWAYQLEIKGTKLTDKFPFLKQKPLSPKPIRQAFHNDRYEAASAIVETYLGKDSPVAIGMRKIAEVACDIVEWFHTDDLMLNGIEETDLDSFMRITSSKPQIDPKNNYEPWRVFIHGDCWTNNFLFRYDEATGIPLEAILIDFQVSKVACPAVDLAYLLYISTTSNFRRKHLQNILQKYYDSFVEMCDAFGCDLLPDFTMQSLQERFHRSKLYALSLSVIVLPMILKDITIKKDVNQNSVEFDINEEITIPYTSLIDKTIVELALDMYQDGIF